MAYIEKVAVKGKSVVVHRHELQQMHDENETLQHYVASLRSKAQHCQFSLTCKSTTCSQINSYAESEVMDKMTTGLYDKDIQAELLAKSELEFEKRYDLALALEEGKRAR